MSWFAENLGRWKIVEEENGQLNCKNMVEAAMCLVGSKENVEGLLDKQEGIIFNRAKSRFKINVAQISEYYYNNNEKFKTVHEMVMHEINAGKSDTSVPCVSRGILWFTRSMQFLVEATTLNLENEDISLPNAFRASYNVSLSKHHNVLVKPIFNAVMMICPSKEEFYKPLSREVSLEQTYEEAKIYFKELARIKDRLVQYCRFMDRKRPGQFDVSFGEEDNDITEAIQIAIKRKRLADSDTLLHGNHKSHKYVLLKDVEKEPISVKKTPEDNVVHKFKRQKQNLEN